MIDKYIVYGGKKLSGEIAVGGAKNAALKAIIASCLTEEEMTIKNIPLISDLYIMLELLSEIGGKYKITDHAVKIRVKKLNNVKLPLDVGTKIRTSSMFLAPLLARKKEAIIPNPGGCRIGARPIDRHIEGLTKMNVNTTYNSEDGYFHAKTTGLKSTTYRFKKNTHTGTETLIMAAVLAKGRTMLENGAQEPEVDDLISLLNLMGAKIKRIKRKIIIDGVKKLHGVEYSIMPDRNEVVTFAIASALTGGNIFIKNAILSDVTAFLSAFKKAGGSWEENEKGVRFFIKKSILPVDIVVAPHPGFMTDWQGPWAVLMTQAKGASTVHETVYENRFSYVEELEKMGAKMRMYKPKVDNPEKFYNFNYDEDENGGKQGLKIYGAKKLHNAVLNIADLRAGATLVLASLLAKGESIIYGIEHLDRGYESFDKSLKKLGADIAYQEEGEHEKEQ